MAAVLYAGFAMLQRAVRSPLMDVRILTRRPVAAGTFLILVATALMIAVFFLGSFYLQHLKGYGALRTGLLFLPVALATIVGAQSAAHVIGRTGPRPVALAGMTLAALGTALPAFWDSSVTVVAGISVAAAGIGASFVAASATALSQVAHDEAGLASGILSTFHEFGAALGVAAVSSIAAASIAGDQQHRIHPRLHLRRDHRRRVRSTGTVRRTGGEAGGERPAARALTRPGVSISAGFAHRCSNSGT